jgi:hypothetical protein
VVLGEPGVYRWRQQVVSLAVSQNEVRHVGVNPSLSHIYYSFNTTYLVASRRFF